MMTCREPCPIDRRIRERADSCLCERIAQAILTGDREALSAIPGEALKRALARTEAITRPEDDDGRP